MKFKCPYCRKDIDLMELQMDGDLYAIIKMSANFGRHNNLVWAYVELFGVTPMKTRSKKIRILLEEMTGLFETQTFTYQKKKYQISAGGVTEALNVMVHRHFETPLENHNYLKKVMIGIAEQEARHAGKQAERDLHKKEEKLRYEFPEERVMDADEGRAPLSHEIKAQIERLTK